MLRGIVRFVISGFKVMRLKVHSLGRRIVVMHTGQVLGFEIKVDLLGAAVLKLCSPDLSVYEPHTSMASYHNAPLQI